MNKTTLNSQEEKYSMLSLRRATQITVMQATDAMPFLSTLSLRRATTGYPLDIPEPKHFYPRSPCGERLMVSMRSRDFSIISIHALLAESDLAPLSYIRLPDNFYPRSPCGERRDTWQRGSRVTYVISIHALLAESDLRVLEVTRNVYTDFYPRSPCGERPRCHCLSRAVRIISIHALLAESDILGRGVVV